MLGGSIGYGLPGPGTGYRLLICQIISSYKAYVEEEVPGGGVGVGEEVPHLDRREL